MSRAPLTVYPDISDILARKAEGRRELSKLTFGEKIARMEALRDRLSPFKGLRDANGRTQISRKPALG